MKVLVTAEVKYFCELNEEDSQKVIQFAKENDCDYETAVGELYWGYHSIDLYDESYEIDFSTERIDEVELDEEEEEEIE